MSDGNKNSFFDFYARISKNKQIWILTIVIYGLSGIAYYEFNVQEYFSIENYILISAAFLGAVYFLVKLFETAKKGTNAEFASAERALSGDMDSLRRDLEKQIKKVENASVNMATGNISSIAEGIVQEKLSEEFGNDLVKALGDKVAKQTAGYARRASIRQAVDDHFNTSIIRINGQAENSESSARLFRMIGLLLAIGGIVIAAANLSIYFIDLLTPANRSETIDLAQMLKHLSFTMPFILLAEVLALIMFRYHSKSLEMMRYFSNEVTTLRLRQAGAALTIEHGTKPSVTDLANNLLKSERNIIMRKDEKTIEMTQNQGEDANQKNILDTFTKYLKQQSDSPNNKSSDSGK